MVLFLLTLEAGQAEPQRRTIRKLAQVLGVDPAELVEQRPLGVTVPKPASG
jgi:hypothetical protein